MMTLQVSEEAARWYKEELSLVGEEKYIRFFPRYGDGGHIPGFSIGMNIDHPEEIFESTEVKSIIFYIEAKDAWYFEDIYLQVSLNESRNEPEFITKSK